MGSIFTCANSLTSPSRRSLLQAFKSSLFQGCGGLKTSKKPLQSNNSTMFGNRYYTEFWRSYALIVAPLALMPIAFQNGGSEEMRCAYCVLLMAAYWMTEALPLPITSLMPMVLFPFLGIMSTNEVGINYLKSTNFMFLGGLILAMAVEQSGLHQRVALKIMMMIGTNPRNLLLGFMLTTGFLSMWISNTATTAMMIPIVDAIAQVSVEGQDPDEDLDDAANKEEAPLASQDPSNADTEPMVEYNVVDSGNGQRPVALVQVGKKTSKYFISETQVLENRFGDSTGLTFASWMAFAVPLMSINLILSWIWLSYLGWKENKRYQLPGEDNIDPKQKEAQILNVMKRKYDSLGPLRCHELSVLICFIIVILLWFFRKPLFMFGWGDLFTFMTARGKKVTVGSATPAILMVLVVFALPTRYRFWPFQALNKAPESSPSLIDWKTVETKLPWGGGFAVSDACTKSGLSKWLVAKCMVLVGLPAWLINTIVCVLTVVLTQVASNTATANVLLPILADLSMTICQNPLYLMLPAAVTSSYAFMLPVATAPNAIVFGASTMTTAHMMKTGFGMNIITVITTLIAINPYAVPLYGLDSFPVWAEPQLPVNVTCA